MITITLGEVTLNVTVAPADRQKMITLADEIIDAAVNLPVRTSTRRLLIAIAGHLASQEPPTPIPGMDILMTGTVARAAQEAIDKAQPGSLGEAAMIVREAGYARWNVTIKDVPDRTPSRFSVTEVSP